MKQPSTFKNAMGKRGRLCVKVLAAKTENLSEFDSWDPHGGGRRTNSYKLSSSL